MFQSARPDCGSASLNKLSKAGSDSLRSRSRNSATQERTDVDHLFGPGTDSTVARGCGLMRSCFLTSLTDLKFISLPSFLITCCQAQVRSEKNLKRVRLFKIALRLYLAWDEIKADQRPGHRPGSIFIRQSFRTQECEALVTIEAVAVAVLICRTEIILLSQ